MCGVRLERRQTDRRAQRTTNVKCSSCGNINEPGYKFCGMCGTRIERRLNERRGNGFAEPVRSNAASSSGQDLTTERRRPESAVGTLERRAGETPPGAERPPLRAERSEHGIPGPSFLGLSDDPDSEGEYLLEDEGSSRRGLRALVLLAVLAAIVGLILVQWRSSFRANPKPAPEVPKTDVSPQPQGQNQPPPAASPTDPPNAQSPQAVASPVSATDPFSDGGKKLLQQAFGSAATDPRSKPAANNAGEKDTPEGDADEAAADPKPITPTHQAPSRLLVKAQQYLQGSGGAPQNCEQGLVYLRAATQKNEPAAAVQMGALYASGHCVKQDRVMAYRWFNSAHELEPSNQWIQQNMGQLWAQMSDQERRQASY
jgi:hypothetical protein